MPQSRRRGGISAQAAAAEAAAARRLAVIDAQNSSRIGTGLYRIGMDDPDSTAAVQADAQAYMQLREQQRAAAAEQHAAAAEQRRVENIQADAREYIDNAPNRPRLVRQERPVDLPQISDLPPLPGPPGTSEDIRMFAHSNVNPQGRIYFTVPQGTHNFPFSDYTRIGGKKRKYTSVLRKKYQQRRRRRNSTKKYKNK
jgi:hypothetical protein